MKASRIVFLVVILCAVGSVSAFAKPIRVGLEFGNPTGVFIIRPEPFDFKVGYSFSEVGQSSSGQGNFVHLSGDYRVINSYPLIDFLSLFLGAGGYVQFWTESQADDAFTMGGRIPVGIQAFLLDGTVEIFFEVAPTVSFFPSITAFDQFQGYLGFTIPLSGLK